MYRRMCSRTSSTGTDSMTCRHLMLLVMASLVAACATSPRVEVQRSPEADFTRYDTFSFHQPLGTDRQEGTATILSQTLKRATRAELESLGYRYVEDDADLQVNFFVETKDLIEGMRPRSGISIGYGVFHRHYGVWTDYGPGTEVRQYTQGTLHFDVVEAESDQLVWEGIARAREPADGFAFEPEDVEQAVDRVFANFPRRVPAAGS